MFSQAKLLSKEFFVFLKTLQFCDQREGRASGAKESLAPPRLAKH